MPDAPQLFALDASRDFGARVAAAMGLPLSPHEEREFEDGEHKSRPLDNVRDRDVYVVQSLHGVGAQGVNDKLIRLLLFVGALKQCGAERVTAVVPYLCYSRKDRRTKPNDPVSTRYVAALIEAVGTDRILTVDVHNLAAFQNAFRCATEHLEARHVFTEAIAAGIGGDEAVVLSPDAGGTKRAERFRERLEQTLRRQVGNGFVEKRRSGGVVSGELLVGEVAGRTVIIVDDLIVGGTTMARAAERCRAEGAARVLGVATHGLFSASASTRLAEAPLEKIFIADTVPPDKLDAALLASKVEVIGVAPLVADALHRLHGGGSLADLSEAYGY